MFVGQKVSYLAHLQQDNVPYTAKQSLLKSDYASVTKSVANQKKGMSIFFPMTILSLLLP